jgi:hypothetical protein
MFNIAAILYTIDELLDHLGNGLLNLFTFLGFLSHCCTPCLIVIGYKVGKFSKKKEPFDAGSIPEAPNRFS